MIVKEGRKKLVCVLVVVGNGKGVVGFVIGKVIDWMDVFRKVKNRVVYYLYYIE